MRTYAIASTILLRTVGAVLVAAAVLKATGRSFDPLSRNGLTAAAWAQLAVVQAEIGLGGWLLSGVAAAGAWLLATATFFAFSAVSFYSGVTGQEDCGCFGAVQVNPWYTFGFDVAVVATLLALRPRPEGRGPLGAVSHGLRPAGVWVGGFAIVVAGSAAAGAVAFGSVPRAMAVLRGEPLLARSPTLDLGEGEFGQAVEGVAVLENVTGRTVRVVAGTSDCTCVSTLALPLVIRPGEVGELPVAMSLRGSPGRVSRTVTLVTDAPGFPRLKLGVTARVRPKADAP